VDLSTIIGLLVAFGSLAGSVLIEGGSLRALVSIPALVIVFGGTLGATFISVPLADILRLPGVLKFAFRPHPFDHADTAREIVRLAGLARRHGLLHLESEIAGLGDDFLIKGLSLVIDGTDAETIRDMMETEIAAMEARHRAAARVFTLMGGLAPTLGVTGTVMGLVNMLANVSEPSSMGPAIATAFLATLYGVASANLVFLPIASKLAIRSAEEAHLREILLEGLVGVQAGQGPTVVEERLKSFLSPGERNWVKDGTDQPRAEAS
jgi:chemotaxis protein MotA